MRLSAIALDYDGTIAHDDRLDPTVREAIAEARARGITVLLVTGRILDELKRVAGDLHVVDAVVAENGGVVHFPHTGRTSTPAPAMIEVFLEEIRRRRIPFHAGHCMVDACADDAPRLLEVIRALEVPLALVFNRGRVMALPQGVSKATGLEFALNALRLSVRNTLAIGDAENDAELLRVAEVGVAVEWASPALRAAADIVLAGAEPSSVGQYLRSLAECSAATIRRRHHASCSARFVIRIRAWSWISRA
jgi:hydroxymethylpyrimidine pyrophosphatase-like HAD family hydrolase